MEWEAELGEDDVRRYDAFIVRSQTASHTLWIYEDLTEKYQAQYPGQQVDKVIRTLVGIVSNPANNP